ncbi:retrotransposon hot spot (RHS) protein [Trypanosoma cruzi]|nr:retrotransposon hot spot (RHS) protein [Trypanosoma cruzi]
MTAVPHGCGTVSSGMRGRTLRAHYVVVVGSLQHCAGWVASTRRRCGGPRACGVHRILCRHTVWVSLLLWLRVMTVPIVFLFIILHVGWLLFRSNSNQLRKQGETMSGRPEEGIYGNLESQSSNVSQGGRRRARSEFESDTDYSSVSRRRLEEMHRPQWTMSSSVKDILLEGSTNRTDMKLNEFLRSNLGDEWVVERNGNVAMGNFVLMPTMFIKDNEILDIITALPSYRELEERKILLEAINKLHHEGVYSLRQWRGFKSKNTFTPHAKGKLNGVLAQVLTEEKRKAEEKREAEEKRKAEEKREAEEKRKAEEKREAE